METEVDGQRLASCCFAVSSSRTQSAVLWSGGERNAFASAFLALHTALMFSSGTPPNAGGVNRGCNTANNTGHASFDPSSMRLERLNLRRATEQPKYAANRCERRQSSGSAALPVVIAAEGRGMTTHCAGILSRPLSWCVSPPRMAGFFACLLG